MLTQLERDTGRHAGLSNHGRILVVDDDEDIRRALADLLADEGYSVETAVNGRDALRKLADMPAPCAILLDLMMPEMNGWQFLTSRERDATLSEIPVVVVSAMAQKSPQVEAVVPKPVDIERLLHTLQGLC